MVARVQGSRAVLGATLASVMAAAACQPLNEPRKVAQGVVVADLVSLPSGGYTVSPSAIFYERGLLDPALFEQESCQLDQSARERVTHEEPQDFWVQTMGAGERVVVETGTPTSRVDTLPPTLTSGMIQYRRPEAIPIAPGDSLRFHVQGAPDEFPAASIATTMVAPLTLEPVVTPAPGQPLRLAWTQLDPHPGAWVYIWYRFSFRQGFSVFNTVVGCRLRDDGEGFFTLELTEMWRNAERSLDSVRVGRERVEFVSIAPRRELYVFTRYGLPFPRATRGSSALRVAPP